MMMLMMQPSSKPPALLVGRTPSRSIGLGEIADGETPVSKLHLPLPKFSVARLLDETNDRFRMRVELATKNVAGSNARGEHDACIMTVLNEGMLNQVF
jgi:hypothetical protein